MYFEGIARKANQDQQYLLDKARERAEREGGKITFQGHYRQGTKESSSFEAQTPFVIIQNPAQMRRIQEGELCGLIYELLDTAEVQGTISKEKVSFLKTYKTQVSRSTFLDFEQRVMQTGEFPSTPIQYRGASSDGVHFSGTWSFDRYWNMDMSNRGTFELSKLIP